MLSFGSFSSYLYLVTAPRRRLQLGRARAVALRRACPYEDDVCRCAAKFSISAEDRAAAAAEFRRRRRVLARLPQLGEEEGSSFAGTLDADPQREEQHEQLQQRKRARSAPVPAPAPAASGKRPAPPGDANKPPGKRAAPPPGEVIDLCDSD